MDDDLEVLAHADDDEAFAEGDPSLDDIDWDQVQVLEQRMAAAYAEIGEARSWAMLALFDELHDGLAVII